MLTYGMPKLTCVIFRHAKSGIGAKTGIKLFGNSVKTGLSMCQKWHRANSGTPDTDSGIHFLTSNVSFWHARCHFWHAKCHFWHAKSRHWTGFYTVYKQCKYLFGARSGIPMSASGMPDAKSWHATCQLVACQILTETVWKQCKNQFLHCLKPKSACQNWHLASRNSLKTV